MPPLPSPVGLFDEPTDPSVEPPGSEEAERPRPSDEPGRPGFPTDEEVFGPRDRPSLDLPFRHDPPDGRAPSDSRGEFEPPPPPPSAGASSPSATERGDAFRHPELQPDWPPRIGPNLPRRLEANLPSIDSIHPLPPPEIPDSPPPHEGAMIGLPYVVNAPDILLVEVLEALPGRPITGERMVRPDGSIALGFYGDVHVAGLTLPQIKVKVILHMRQFVTDQVLGLWGYEADGFPMVIPPAASDRVFVDVAQYNSTVYYVQGDVPRPGRLPVTGGDTVLDALNYAANLGPTAHRKDVKLVRPARGDRPARVYPIDLEAILERGDPTANLQLFPGDRLVVGRHPDIEAGDEPDQVSASSLAGLDGIARAGSAARSIHDAPEGREDPTPERRRELVRELVDFFWAAATRGEGEPLDEASFRRAILGLMEPEGD